jgi:hypothetical protein
MKHTLLSMILIALFLSVAAQNTNSPTFTVQVNDCDDPAGEPISKTKEIEAAFRMDKSYGSAPLTIEFTDRSTGGAAKWLWKFGDGDSAIVKNPVHTYQQEGIFTIKLSVWDQDSTSVDATSAEIRGVGYGVCDSVNYDIPGSYYLYRVAAPETGYLSGNNSKGDLAKASYFNISEEKGMLMGGMFYFAKKTSSFTTDPQIKIFAWDNDGPNGSPGTVLDSSSVLLSNVLVDDQGTGIYPATMVFFDQWVTIDHDFYMGFEMPRSAGDTLAVFTNKINAVTNGNGWEQSASGEWRTYSEGNPGFDVDNAIFPVICQPTGIHNPLLETEVVVYPVPAKDLVYISWFDPDIEFSGVSVLDISGRLVLKTDTPVTSGMAVDVSHLSEGIYLMRLHTQSRVYNRKIIIE